MLYLITIYENLIRIIKWEVCFAFAFLRSRLNHLFIPRTSLVPCPKGGNRELVQVICSDAFTMEFKNKEFGAYLIVPERC
eukprot:c40264_g1_i1 orf=438-677(+)